MSLAVWGFTGPASDWYLTSLANTPLLSKTVLTILSASATSRSGAIFFANSSCFAFVSRSRLSRSACAISASWSWIVGIPGRFSDSGSVVISSSTSTVSWVVSWGEVSSNLSGSTSFFTLSSNIGLLFASS